MTEIDRPQVVLVTRCLVENEANELLLVRRSLEDNFSPGLWEFPGGKLDAGQDLDQALEREVIEETGLSVRTTANVVFAESFVIRDGRYEGLTYIGLFGLARAVSGSVRLSHEHEDFAWASYEEALEYDLTNESRKALIALGDTALLGNARTA